MLSRQHILQGLFVLPTPCTWCFVFWGSPCTCKQGHTGTAYKTFQIHLLLIMKWKTLLTVSILDFCACILAHLTQTWNVKTRNTDNIKFFHMNIFMLSRAEKECKALPLIINVCKDKGSYHASKWWFANLIKQINPYNVKRIAEPASTSFGWS